MNQELANDSTKSLEERKFELELAKFELDRSKAAADRAFPRTWGPILASFVIGCITSYIAYNQYNVSADAAQRQRAEWGLKVIEMSLRPEFDAKKTDPDTVASNWKALVIFAPPEINPPQILRRATEVQLAGASRNPEAATNPDIPAFSESTLAVVSKIQEISSAQSPAQSTAPSSTNTTVYIQYADDRAEAAAIQSMLGKLGYRAPGIEKVAAFNGPSQIRYYHEDQAEIANRLYENLGFDPSKRSENVINIGRGKNLPFGVMEVWIQKKRG